MAYLIGLDIGTTSAKACLFDEAGHLHHSVERDITTVYQQADWAEQDVQQIERLATAAIRQLILDSNIDKDDILAVSFCSAMHSLVAVDKTYEPLTKALIWSDRRAAHCLSSLTEQQKQAVYERTGTPIHPMTPYSKLLWMRANKTELYNSRPYWMSIKEYLLLKWCNVRWIDYSMASATGLFNLTDKTWDKQLLSELNLRVEQLSTIHSPQTILPALNEEARNQLGLSKRTVVVLGAADGQLSNLGIGAIGKGEIAISVGTSGALREYTTEIQLSSQRATFCYMFDDNYYIVGGPTNNGGVVLQWLKQLIAPDKTYNQFLALADEVDIGANGLLFLPYLNGERAPLWDANAKGHFFGLSINHEAKHMVRAALEGITYNLYHILKSVKLNKTLDCIYVNGGLSRSSLWLQILANVFNVKVYIAHTHHGAAWGACWIALMSLGKQQSYEALKDTLHYEEPILPQADKHEQYVEQFDNYINVLNAVRPLF